MQYAKGCFKAGLCPAFYFAFSRGGKEGRKALNGLYKAFNLGGGRAKRESVRMQAARRNCAGGNIVLQKNAKKGDMVRIVHLPSGHGVI